eukprot:14684898-Alexandrium_andersonii.AAC.1
MCGRGRSKLRHPRPAAPAFPPGAGGQPPGAESSSSSGSEVPPPPGPPVDESAFAGDPHGEGQVDEHDVEHLDRRR